MTPILLRRRAAVVWLALALNGLMLSASAAQAQPVVRPGAPVALKAAGYDVGTSRPFFRPAGKAAPAPTATFVITFDDGFPADAQMAFAYAASIWATHLVSSEPIRVRASWEPLGADVLGAAGPYLVNGFPGQPAPGTWYPLALAEAISGENYNNTNPDIEAVFSSEFANWYFGLDGRPPAGTFDFVTVVLHELGHGLGFSGSFDLEDGSGVCQVEADAGEGCWGMFSASGALYPMVYDRFVLDASGAALLNTAAYPNPSASLGAALQSGQVYFNGAATLAANGGVPATLYAPQAFEPGSSFSHLDEDGYPAGNLNSLMTPYLNLSEGVHSPGAVACGILSDTGWPLGPDCAGTTADAALVLTGAPGADGADRGWRMLASPVEGATRAGLEDDLDFAGVNTGNLLYTWEGGAWAPSTSATPLPRGRGFVLFFFDDADDPIDPMAVIDLAGAVPNTAVDVDGLAQGERFFLLGNPYSTGFDLTAMDLAGNGFQVTAQVWDPGARSYRLLMSDDWLGGDPTGSDLVAAWQGFFVERTAMGAGGTSLSFPAEGRLVTPGPFFGKTRSASLATRLGLRLVARDGAGREVARDEAARVYLGEGADDGWDAFDAAKLAPPGGGRSVRLAFAGEREGEAVLKAQESRPLSFASRVELPLSVDAAGIAGTLELSWPEWVNVPEGWRVELVDDATGARVDLRAAGSYSFEHNGAAEGEVRFRLVLDAGTAVGSEGEQTAGGVELRGSRPNPARGAATVEFALPEAGDVRLVLYDVLGRQVRVLASGAHGAGVHRANVDVSGLASGPYVYRLEAGGRVLTGRLVVVR